MEKILTVFGSGNIAPSEQVYKDAIEIGKTVSMLGYTVCSGGYYGIMEAVSLGAKQAGGKTIGVVVESWKNKPNEFIDEAVKMPNLMERLTELVALGDVYIVFKGGTGTLVEIAVTLELMNKNAMKEKKMIFYTSFWKNVIETISTDSEQLDKIVRDNVVFTDLLSYTHKQRRTQQLFESILKL